MTVSDQAVSAATTFLTIVAGGRLAGPRGLGEISLGLAVAFFFLALERAVVGEPLLVMAREGRGRGALGLALLIGIFAGLGTFIVGLVLGGGLGRTLTVLGIFMPVAILQDAARYLAIGEGRPKVSLLSDVSWLSCQALIIFFVATADGGPVPSAEPGTSVNVVVAWGLGALAGLVVFLAKGLRPQLGSVPSWVKSSRQFGGWTGGQVVLAQIGSQITLVGIGALTGLGGLGRLRAVQSLLGPLNMTLTGLGLYALPRIAVRLEHQREPFIRTILRSAILPSLLGAAYCLGLLLFRAPALTGIFGDRFAEAEPLVLPTILAGLFFAIAAASGWGARALRAGWVVLATQVAAIAIGVPLTLFLAARAGVVGAAWGFASQALVLGTTAWLLLYIAAKKSQRHSATHPSETIDS